MYMPLHRQVHCTKNTSVACCIDDTKERDTGRRGSACTAPSLSPCRCACTWRSSAGKTHRPRHNSRMKTTPPIHRTCKMCYAHKSHSLMSRNCHRRQRGTARRRTGSLACHRTQCSSQQRRCWHRRTTDSRARTARANIENRTEHHRATSYSQ